MNNNNSKKWKKNGFYTHNKEVTFTSAYEQAMAK